MAEIWKTIKVEGWEEDLYEISNLGRVRKIDTGRILKQSTNAGGYYFICLRNILKRKSFLVHRLIAEYFIPKIEGFNLVDHINRNRLDNRIENLRWADYCINNQNKSNFVGTQIYLVHNNSRDTFSWRVNYYISGNKGRIEKQFSYADKEEAFQFYLDKGGNKEYLEKIENDF